jgi:anti-sigma B factor antagonist
MSGRRTAQIVVIGEFDLLNRDRLDSTVRQIIADGYANVQMDLSQVTFMDVSIVHALIRCWDQAAEQGCRLRVVDPSPTAQLILTATGTGAVLCPDDPGDPGAMPAYRRTVVGRQANRTDPSIEALRATAELTIAKAREVMDESRRLLDSKRPRTPDQ